MLTLSATTAAVSSGVALLAIYSLGLAVPFLIAAAFMGYFIRRLRTMSRLGRPLQIGTGVVLIVMGIAMVTGYLSVFANWMLRAFPVLGTIG